MTAMRRLRRMRDCQSGAAAVEFAFVGLAMVLMGFAVVDFGRGLYVRDKIAYAADVASRVAMLNRNAADGVLESAIRSAYDGPAPASLEVTLGAESVAGVSYRTLLIRYPLSLRMPGLTATVINLNVARRIPLV